MRYEIAAMRFQKFGMVGLVALLAARAFVGCSSDAGEPGYDAGTLPEAAIGEAGGNEDTGAIAAGDDAGGDATLGDDGGGSSDDGGGDTSLREGTDAGDAGHEVDASDAGYASDASDAGHEVDASDAGHEVDANDAASPVVDAGDASSSDADASDASSSAVDASDAAPACVSCGSTVSFLGNTAGFVSVGGATVDIQGGTLIAGTAVSIITQTYPQGSVTAGHAHVIYATDPSFTTQVDAPMTFDRQTNNNDQWYVVLPAQPASTTVYFYLRAEGCDCSTVLYGNPTGAGNYTYTEQ